MAPQGIYEYTIARTKYIDTVFKEALAKGLDQILIFGAGFDTRALRLRAEDSDTRIFELDTPITQGAKLKQYEKRGVNIPSNVRFISIDFDKDALAERLREERFEVGKRSLFVLEGLLMYLQPESVDETFKLITRFAGEGSEVVFDYVQGSVLRQEGKYYGEREIIRAVEKAGECWYFGIEEGELEQFLEKYDLRLAEQQGAQELEQMYFTDESGEVVGRINSTHCLVRAIKNSRE